MTIAKITLTALALTLSAAAFADDALVGNWKTFEDGQPKAIVQIKQSGDTFTGVVVQGISDKSKAHVGKTVIMGLKALGGGKYGDGQITDPTNGKVYDLKATLNGKTLKLKGGYKVGGLMVGRSQTWQKQ